MKSENENGKAECDRSSDLWLFQRLVIGWSKFQISKLSRAAQSPNTFSSSSLCTHRFPILFRLPRMMNKIFVYY